MEFLWVRRPHVMCPSARMRFFLNTCDAVVQMNQQDHNQTFPAMRRAIFQRPVIGIQHGKPIDKTFM